MPHLAVISLVAIAAAPPPVPAEAPAKPTLNAPVIVAPAVPPNLVYTAARLPAFASSGWVSVSNIGLGGAGPSTLSIRCQKVGVASGGGCPEVPAALFATDPLTFVDPALPDMIGVHIPAIGARRTFSHRIKWLGALKWPSGDYEFTLKVDALATVAETNEDDNGATVVKHVP